MTSTVTLYLKCLVEKDKNFILDSVDDDETGNPEIDTYLATLSSTVISNFQYVKHGLSISIKIDKSQTALNMGDGASDLNYCKIQNGTENPCYYFIVSKNWRSQNTVELVLQMDTLNTYYYNADYKISKKTFIKRMHKDRFVSLEQSSFNFSFDNFGKIYSYTNIAINKFTPTDVVVTAPTGVTASASIVTEDGIRYIRVTCLTLIAGTHTVSVSYSLKGKRAIVDLKSEEIIAPVYKTYEHTLYDSRSPIQDWVLYYKTANDQSTTPIDCYLLPSEPIEINYQQNAGTFDTNNVPTGKYLVLSSTFPSGDITIQYGTKTVSTSTDELGLNEKLIAIYNDSGTIKLYVGSFYDLSIHGIFWGSVIYSGSSVSVVTPPPTIYSYETSTLPTYIEWRIIQFGGHNHTTSMGSYSTGVLFSNIDIDKTEPTNIKVIDIPYSPTPYSINNLGVYTFDSCWEFNSGDGRVKLVDFTRRFINDIKTDEDSILDPLFTSFDSQYWDEHTQQRTFIDPKLYHSDFYRPKFVYDSFAKIFPIEEMNIPESSIEKGFKFQFVMSRNIVSKFLFKFDQFIYNHSKEDYDNILAVSRNNEEVLYNSQYLDYIRTGYNYDLKAKERTEVASGIGIGLNVASLLGSLAIGAVSGNPIGWAGAFASGIGLVSQLVNYSKNVAQNEENIQKKLQEAQMQAVSVLNADDSDLLYIYSENKAKLCIYEVSTDMQRVLSDLFHYCGYTINKQGMPDVYSRRSFNFLQATLVIDETNNLTNEIVEDIKEKFENGVTFLHLNFNHFDFAQDKENIEMSLF